MSADRMLLGALQTGVSLLRARHSGFRLHQRQYATKSSRKNIAGRAMASGDGLAPMAKRLKSNGSSWEHHIGDTYAVPGLQITDHTIRVPLDHTGAGRGEAALPSLPLPLFFPGPAPASPLCLAID